MSLYFLGTRDHMLRADMGGPHAATPVSVAVSGLLKLAGALTPKDSGAFLNLQGERIPW